MWQSLGRSHYLLPIIAAVTYGLCALFFAKGFLLNRVEIHKHQQCDTIKPSVIEPIILQASNVSSEQQDVSNGNDETIAIPYESGKASCRTFSRFKKAIFIVVDALRYDFSVFDPSKNESILRPYQNKLSMIYQLVRQKPQNCLLMKFIADPPTTTMQRLKGLTTGGLPTFVDAGKNFASSEIDEDNLIYQMDKARKRIVFMGDDTWESLYKKHFNKSFPFPSFNVKDLHTVDNGCIANLVPELEQGNWDIIIAHFLGVDHCGHRFGPDHPAMAEKLLQINVVLKSVVERLPKDSVLFVLGDHGMTKTGDHGGDSAEEIGAALFAYSPSELRSKGKSQIQESVAQIDLVPTVALLLGLPIPFSNLGRLMPDFFTIPSQRFAFPLELPENVKANLSYVCALDRNARQVKNYIEMYQNLTGAFPRSLLLQSENMFKKAELLMKSLSGKLKSGRELKLDMFLEDLILTESLLTSYLDFIKHMCHQIWVQFEDFSMNIGICILLSMLLMNLLPLFQVSVHYVLVFIPQFIFLTYQLNSVHVYIAEVAVITLESWILQQFSSRANKFDDPTRTWQTSVHDFIVVIICATHSISLTSNSYVMYESYVISYLMNSVVTFVFINISFRIRPPMYSKKRFYFGKFPMMAVLLLLFLFVSRFGQMFWSCREEQPWCDVSPFLIPLSNLRLTASRIASLRYIISGVSVITPVFLVKRWFEKQGNLEVPFLRMFPIKYGCPLAAICIFLYWALLAVPSSSLDLLPPWQQTVLPQTAFFMLLVSFTSLIAHPVSAYLKKEEKRNFHEISQNRVDEKPRTNAHLRNKSASSRKYGTSLLTQRVKADETNNAVSIVHGLGTVYFVNLIQFLLTVYLLLSLLLGDGFGLSMMFIVLQISILFAIRTLDEGDDNLEVPFVPVWLIAVWSLMSMHYFFSTGHQATITSIRFESAFIGYHGNYPPYLYWIPALLILLNTFAAQVLFAAALPLTLLWPLTQRNKAKTYGGNVRVEMELQQDPDLMKRGLSHLITHYVSFQALQLLGTMTSAAIHQRHLMTWSIFAPRFIFQLVGFLMTLPALAASCGILVFTHHCLSKCIDKPLK